MKLNYINDTKIIRSLLYFGIGDKLHDLDISITDYCDYNHNKILEKIKPFIGKNAEIEIDNLITAAMTDCEYYGFDY